MLQMLSFWDSVGLYRGVGEVMGILDTVKWVKAPACA
jgi:hypothetical protein